jgi:hypothetical protein
LLHHAISIKDIFSIIVSRWLERDDNILYYLGYSMKEKISLILGIFYVSLGCATPVLAQINTETNTYSAETTSTSGNVSMSVAPQGTTLGPTNDTSAPENTTTSTSGNVSMSVAPQGTTLGPTNKSS